MLPLLSAISIICMIPVLSVAYHRFLDRDVARRSAMLTAAISVGAGVLWLTGSSLVPGVSESPLWLPIASLSALAGFICSLPVRDVTSSRTAVLLYSLGWVLVVFLPLGLVVFPPHLGIDPALLPIDMGGALAVHVAVGASAMALLLAGRGFPLSGRGHPLPSAGLVVASAILIPLFWTVAMVGLELAIDDATPLIVAGNILAALAAAVGWMVVERIHRKASSPSGVLAGLLCGLVAAAPGGGTLSPAWSIATGALAGVASATFVFSRSTASGRSAWVLVGVHFVAAALGLVSVGLFGEGFGFVFTGQVDILGAQLLGTIVAGCWAAGASLVLWPVARSLTARRWNPVGR